MTGNYSVLQEGSTLITDHKQAVEALEEILAAGNLDTAKSVATKVLKDIGEIPTPGNVNPHLQNRDPS